MNPFRRLLHRRCDHVVEHLAQTAGALTHRAETAEADLHAAEHEVREVRDDLMCTEHDLEQAHQRLRGLKNQFARVLETAYAAGTLYRTWGVLWPSLDEDTRPVLETAARTAADIPALDKFVKIHSGDGFWGAPSAPERCLDPFCHLETGLVVVRHSAAEDRARMLCTACGRHWGLPRYLAPVLDGQRWRPADPAGGRTPLAEERPAVLAAVDAALPPAPAGLAAAA